jgi:hypothetical protein
MARRLLVVLFCALAWALAQQLRADESPAAPRLGEPVVSQWQFGVKVNAPGAVTGIVATLPVPMDWPEQSVRIVKEEKSPGISRISYRTLDGGVRQMVVTIPRLAAGQEASAIVTMEIAKRQILEPAETASLVVPDRGGRELAKYLAPSPYIESNDPRIKSLASTVAQGKDAGWDRSAAIFDWVRANVKYEFAEAIQPAVAALDSRVGDCEELSSLVIALCRANRIPARAVWVPGHTYPEFYLVDEAGRGHWYPCQAAGEDRQFGSMIEDRPILQKGDNFKVPDERQPQRYVQQRLSARNAAASPAVEWIMRPVK